MLLSLNENTSSMTKTRLVEHDITFEKDNHIENLKIAASHCSAACDRTQSEIIRLAALNQPEVARVGEGGEFYLSGFETWLMKESLTLHYKSPNLIFFLLLSYEYLGELWIVNQ